MEKLSSLPVQAQGLIDDSPGGSAVPIALGAAQRRPGDHAGALPQNPRSSQDASRWEDEQPESIISITAYP